ncbi:hypothetical protein [Demequina soli]|uniref:hypothetical protein n=1 Tax=Demequina soli TaxID=1638987 RepID=UPI000A5CC730|nr:hypothetical protein [Demequina soli]
MRLRQSIVTVAVAALALIGLVPAANASTGGGQPGNDGVHQVWVCKYVGKPGDDERLKDGKNPIAVDGNATVGTYFNDAQGRSYVLDEVTDANTGQGQTYTGSKTCPTGDSFDWNWQYGAPTCAALTVTYPADIPAGQANDVNVTIKNLATNAEKTLNFHNNGGTWSGTQTFTFASNAGWPGWSWYAVTWVQVGGTNYHWSGSVTCGERPKPDKPADSTVPTEWKATDYSCSAEETTFTRSVTTTTFSWDEASWSWKSSSDTTTETKTEAMTDAEKAAQCTEPPVDVCKNIDGVQTEVPAGYKVDDQGNCCKCVPPVVDVCKNIDGIQATVPDGYKVDDQGNCCKCVPPVVDLCKNIAGDQGTVPEGMTRDEHGKCWPPKPEKQPTYTEWSVQDYVCESESITETRERTDTTYTWDYETGTWVEHTSTTTETREIPMDENQLAEYCTPPVDVCTNLPGTQEEVPEGLQEVEGICLMPPKFSDIEWQGEAPCGVTSYEQTGTQTETTYALEIVDGEVRWIPTTTPPEPMTRTVEVAMTPCEDSTAALVTTPPTCDAAGTVGVDTEGTVNATLEGTLETAPGEYTATFVADEGHAFTGGETTMTIDYTIEAQLTEGCSPVTPTPPNLNGTIVGQICTADAPYLGYDIQLNDPDNQSTDDGTATITFVHPTDPSKNWSTTVPIGRGKVLWPGASVDANGVANNWPGYKYNKGKDEWVAVGDANYGWTREPGTTVTIEVNPSKTFQVSYPPATPVCNSAPPKEIVSVLDAPPATAVVGVATYTG